MEKIFAFCNQKGGVGKTTSAVNLATLCALAGYKTLLLDMDSQGNATSGVGLDRAAFEFTSYQLLVDNSEPAEIIVKTGIENLDIIPANTDLSGADLDLVNADRREFVLTGKLAPLKEQYDFIFIDCPPSLGLITVNCLVASDCVLIPLQCEYYALEGLGHLMQTYKLIQENLKPELQIGGIILTMADFRTNLTQQVIEEVRNHFKDTAFQSVIPRAVKMSEAPSFGKPAVLYDPHNKASKSYEALSREFLSKFRPRGEKSLRADEASSGEPSHKSELPSVIDRARHKMPSDETAAANEGRTL